MNSSYDAQEHFHSQCASYDLAANSGDVVYVVVDERSDVESCTSWAYVDQLGPH